MTMINKTVDVNAFYFTGNKDLKTFPRQIQFGNRQYTFKDGLSRLVQRGQKMFELFDMTDGQTTFRLARLNDEWRLIATIAAVQS